jgi:hypothetical protein
MIRTTLHRVRATGIALGLLAAFAVHAQEAAVTKRATELRDAPAESGKSLASLPAQAPVTRLGERRGPWVQVRSEAGATGWVHLFDVGPATGGASTQAPAAGGSGTTGALRSVTNFFNRGGSAPTGGSSVSTSTIGIRGLSAEDLANAQPNVQAVGQLEALRQSENDARSFAGSAALRPQEVEPLPAPARPSSGGGGGAQPGNPGTAP